LRTLFRDLQVLSRRYYVSDSGQQTEIRANFNAVELSFGPSPVVTAMSDSTQPRGSCGKIIQGSEFIVMVEYCEGKGDDRVEVQGV
jgi:hypothetical protein